MVFLSIFVKEKVAKICVRAIDPYVCCPMHINYLLSFCLFVSEVLLKKECVVAKRDSELQEDAPIIFSSLEL